MTDNYMEPVADLEKRIREAYTIIYEYKDLQSTDNSPKQIHDYEKTISQQWRFIEDYLTDYFGICQKLKKSVPEDIQQIAAYFPQFLAEDFRQAYTTLRRVVPEDVKALNQLTRVLHKLGEIHERLNEWKETHNLLQECITAFAPLKNELDIVQDSPELWRRSNGRRLWDPCRTKLRQLELFACEIKYIDRPFHRNEKTVQGPNWMVKIATLQNELEHCLRESDPQIIYDSTLMLWDSCYDALYIADKRLRDMVSQAYMLSNAILRGVENDD